jgi:hypothetical protein
MCLVIVEVVVVTKNKKKPSQQKRRERESENNSLMFRKQKKIRVEKNGKNFLIPLNKHDISGNFPCSCVLWWLLKTKSLIVQQKIIKIQS